MVIVHVHVRVKPDQVDAFVEATRANARASLGEPGILRFDVVRDESESDRFVLVEVYRTDADPAKHKQTVHYAQWRDAVEPMMAEPRRSVKYRDVYPLGASGWSSSPGE
jgi:autoinducer 2-degrading protein